MELNDAMQLELQARKGAVAAAAEDLQYQADAIKGSDYDSADARKHVTQAAADLGYVRTCLGGHVDRLGGAQLMRVYAQSVEQSCRFASDIVLFEGVDCAETAPAVIDQCQRLAASLIEQVDDIETRLGDAEAAN